MFSGGHARHLFAFGKSWNWYVHVRRAMYLVKVARVRRWYGWATHSRRSMRIERGDERALAEGPAHNCGRAKWVRYHANRPLVLARHRLNAAETVRLRENGELRPSIQEPTRSPNAAEYLARPLCVRRHHWHDDPFSSCGAAGPVVLCLTCDASG